MLKKYFLHNGQSQIGPYEISHLREMKISPETYVWFEGISNWTKAKDVPELGVLFIASAVPPPFPPNLTAPPQNRPNVPPPINRPPQQAVMPPKRKSNTALIVGIVLGAVLLLGASGILIYKNIRHSGSSGDWVSELATAAAEKSPEELRVELKQKESDQPKYYLTVDAAWKLNIWGETVITGTISNTASVATFKDVRLKMTYYSKTGTYLDSETFTVYETIPPGGTKSFKIKTYTSKQALKFDADVDGALGVEY